MIDGTHTTRDWQGHPGRVAVWGVGSLEQHSVHLPLATDTRFADHFAQMAAAELDAALLPTLPLGTSLEQSGFRGTVSLRPETLMQVVRDVADEVERQGFTTLVIVNGHGGNHALVPVARDINRLDRPLKILLVDFWEVADPAIEAAPAQTRPAFHADEWETSLALALWPDLVRAERADTPPPPAEAHPLAQRDLTTFGVGHFNPEGATGTPSLGTAARGRLILESIRARLGPFLRDRLARLERNRRYAGAGGIALRGLLPSDLPDAMRLKDLAGWNQTPGDWRFWLGAAPDGCFAAMHNGRLIGTAVALSYGTACGWIGMMLVHPEFRRTGVGTRLLQAALDHLAGCAGVRLDATPAGHPLYRKLGFVDEGVVFRMISPCVVPPIAGAGAVRRAGPADLGAMADLDARAFGVRREAVIARLAAEAPGGAWVAETGGAVSGFALGRPGAQLQHVGPVVAGSLAEAQALVCAAVRGLVGRAVVLDVPEAQVALREWLASVGLTAQRSLLRMARGTPPAGTPARVFATAGPDLG